MNPMAGIAAISLVCFVTIAAMCICATAQAALERRTSASDPNGKNQDLLLEARFAKMYRELMPEDQNEVLQFIDWLMRSDTQDRYRIR